MFDAQKSLMILSAVKNNTRLRQSLDDKSIEDAKIGKKQEFSAKKMDNAMVVSPCAILLSPPPMNIIKKYAHH